MTLLISKGGWKYFSNDFFVQSVQAFCMPNGPKISAGGSLSPRGDWRARLTGMPLHGSKSLSETFRFKRVLQSGCSAGSGCKPHERSLRLWDRPAQCLGRRCHAEHAALNFGCSCFMIMARFNPFLKSVRLSIV
jgi:hypothetical protein